MLVRSVDILVLVLLDAVFSPASQRVHPTSMDYKEKVYCLQPPVKSTDVLWQSPRDFVQRTDAACLNWGWPAVALGCPI